jgi:hypothetical protein
MRVYLLLLTTGALVMGGAPGASAACGYYKEVTAGQTFQVSSPNYPDNYPKGVECLWEFVAPSNSKFTLSCSVFSLPYVSAYCANMYRCPFGMALGFVSVNIHNNNRNSAFLRCDTWISNNVD